MKVAVRYQSRSGNTQKVAEAIGKAVGTEARAVDTPLEQPIDLLFLGGALYAGNLDSALHAFAEQLTPGSVKKVAIFFTSASGRAGDDKLRKILEPKGIAVCDRVFACQGKFLFANKGRPNEQDLANAANFAKTMLEK